MERRRKEKSNKTVKSEREGDYETQVNIHQLIRTFHEPIELSGLFGRFLELNVHSPDDNPNKPDLVSSVERNSSKGAWPVSCFIDTATDVRALQIGGIPLIRRFVSSFVLFFPFV